MATDADRILNDALRLPESDRAVIACKLIESLDEPADENDVIPAWADEIERRLRELDDGTVKAVPWEEARRQIRESDDGSLAD
jgi:putative addiction module component (TIGR02574 family)